MNKADLVTAMATNGGLTKKDSELALNAFIQVVETAMEGEDDVTIANFGKFCVKTLAARTGTNPRTREKMELPARRTPKFIPAKALKQIAKGE